MKKIFVSLVILGTLSSCKKSNYDPYIANWKLVALKSGYPNPEIPLAVPPITMRFTPDTYEKHNDGKLTANGTYKTFFEKDPNTGNQRNVIVFNNNPDTKVPIVINIYDLTIYYDQSIYVSDQAREIYKKQ